MIVEWNEHMFSADDARYPFSPAAAYIPTGPMRKADPYAAYHARMAREGIDAAVLVQPEPYGDDHRLVLDCLAQDRAHLRVSSLFLPKDPDAPAKLADLVAREPGIVATRFHAHRGKEQYLENFADAGVRALWRQAGALDLFVELHIGPEYAAQAGEAIRAFPDVPVLIDHLAEPAYGTAEEYTHVLALAQFPNVYMKLSGLGHFAKDAPLYPDALPLTQRVVAAFGPDRLVWGGDTPAIVDAHMPGFSAAERAKVKGGTLATLLGFTA